MIKTVLRKGEIKRIPHPQGDIIVKVLEVYDNNEALVQPTEFKVEAKRVKGYMLFN